MMRKAARWIVGTVFLLDLVFVAIVLSGGWSQPWAQETHPVGGDTPGTVTADDSTDPWTQAAVQELGERLSERSAELDEREGDLRELVRGLEVLRQTGLLDEEGLDGAAAAREPDGAAANVPAEAATPAAVSAREAFTRLQRAYENMEPTTAAMALERLAARDPEAVIQLVIGWNPRVSGAILDALTQDNPELSADLSYAIWKMSEGDRE